MIGIAVVLLFGWLIKKLLANPAKPRSARYWMKYVVAHFYAKTITKKWLPYFSFSTKTDNLGSLGVFNPPDAWEKDCPRKFSDENSHTADTVEIWGGDRQGNLLLVSLWRRPDRQTEVILYLKLSNGDVYQLPQHPDTIVNYTDGQSFSAAGLCVEIHEPIRRCRITFSGQLRKGVQNQWAELGDNENLVDVQFCFTWHPQSMYYTFTNIHDVSTVTDILAQCAWAKDTLKNPKFCNFEGFENWGHWYGTINIAGEKEKRLYLRGSRERNYGVYDWNNLQQCVIIKGYTRKGVGIHVEVNNTTETIKNVIYGYFSIPGDMKQLAATRIDWDIDTLSSSTSLPSTFSYNVFANNSNYELQGKVNSEFGFRLLRGNNWSSETLVQPIYFKLNAGDDGYGFLIVSRPYLGACLTARPPTLPLVQDSLSSAEKVTLNFEDVLCTNGQLVGGKGASLAHLTKIKTEIDRHKFGVPPGFCITNLGFNMMVNFNKDVESQIQDVENVAWQKIDGSLQDVCQSCMNLISKVEVPKAVKDAVVERLKELHGTDYEQKSFAVRSSAIGEDGEELSSAGQNETFLGVTGLQNIFSAIAKCWASQFAFRSVEYRRQNGQLINGGMAVVVQTMVAAESAGVLFSRDPLSGSKSKMTIASNYGLGESVVSALADPDTIDIRRDFRDRLTITNKHIGRKNLKVIISDVGGTVEETNSSVDSQQCSLSDDLIIKLSEIAIYLEKRYGNARDLEWAVINNELFILQSRPVTTGVAITDDELMHEFDTGMRSDFEMRTNANIGEVMPGAHTPLMITAGRRVHGTCFMRTPHFSKFNRYDPTFSGGMYYINNHIFFDRIQQMSWGMEEEKSMMTKSMELGFFGRVLEEDDIIKELLKERYPLPGRKEKLMGYIYPFMGMVIGNRFLKGAEERYRHFPVHAKGAKSAKEAFDKICDKVMSIHEILMGHIQVMMGSNLWNIAILKILAGDSSDFTLEHYHDFAMLVGSNNGAESGDIPFRMTELVNLIASASDYKDFENMDAEVALTRISNDHGIVGEKYRQFMSCHGHRGIREFELRIPSWGMNPKSFIVVLQKMVKGTSAQVLQTNTVTSIEESIKKISTPLSYFKKKLLAFVLKRCKSGVCFREQAKSMMIKVEDCLRQSFHILAKHMVNEGYLPDQDLIYFLTFEEVGQVLQTKSASLLARAQKRRRIYPKMDAIYFEEISTGLPEHWDKEEDLSDNVLTANFELRAYPVCHGSVKGTARVITSLDDAHLIEKGDILITHATDIGWSPYFPMLSGIVTELGGLISHGAVVAREYGLPCLVAAANATRLFKSGDYVHLDSNNGILKKLS